MLWKEHNMNNILKLAGTALIAGIATITIASPASAAGSWTCHGTSGSKVDAASSCVTTPAPVVQAPSYPFRLGQAGHHRHGHR
jgi:hypothetical protein